jgi:hypothetical protein
LVSAAGAGFDAAGTAAAATANKTVPTSTTTTNPATPNGASTTTVRSWLAYHGSVFASLKIDLETVTAAGDNGSVSSITAGCDQLGADTATIEGLPPIPVAHVQGQWRAALADFARAAGDCVEGLTHDDTRLSDRYKPEVESGIAGVNRVVRELKKLE